MLKKISCWPLFLGFITAAEITDYWSGHTVLPPTFDSLNVTSIPSCIHRCNIRNGCNMVAVSLSSQAGYGIVCLLAWMACYERYASRIAKAEGWDVYGFRDKGMHLKTPLNLHSYCVFLDSSNSDV